MPQQTSAGTDLVKNLSLDNSTAHLILEVNSVDKTGEIVGWISDKFHVELEKHQHVWYRQDGERIWALIPFNRAQCNRAMYVLDKRVNIL